MTSDYGRNLFGDLTDCARSYASSNPISEVWGSHHDAAAFDSLQHDLVPVQPLERRGARTTTAPISPRGGPLKWGWRQSGSGLAGCVWRLPTRSAATTATSSRTPSGSRAPERMVGTVCGRSTSVTEKASASPVGSAEPV
jgi:hypothetical protein